MKKVIDIKKLSVGYRQQNIIEDLNLSFFRGDFCALLGPNGAGKSSLLKALIGYILPQKGSILYFDEDIRLWSKNRLARLISIIPQDFQLQFDYTVEDIVLMGRFPYLDFWQRYHRNDRMIVQDVLEQLNLTELKNKLFSQLSGGEKRRVSIARALAQQTEIILLDEAFANLDINHELEIINLLQEINLKQGKLIILVSHNINLAAEYCHRIVLMKDGRIVADGRPETIINKANLKLLYQSEFPMMQNPLTGKPNLIYQAKRKTQDES
jgi:iron complex transport system ATP-binding protein